jgi:uncharacterized membrane protein YbhN (UPF0104 family)
VDRIWRALETSVARLASARPEYVLAALALYIASLFIVGARWRGFVRALGGDAGVVRSTLATLAGISVGNLAPTSRLGGEACRIALVRLSGSVTWRQAGIAAVWDRLSEVPPILVLAAAATVAMRQLSSTWRTAAIVAGLAVVIVAGGIGLRSLSRAGGLPGGWRERLALNLVPPRTFAAGVGYSTLVWLQDVLRLACATLALGVVLSPTQIATLSILAMVGGLVPSVAGLGPVEGSLMAGLTAFGVDFPTAAAVTAVERAISYGFSTAAGGAVIVSLGGRSLWRAIRIADAATAAGPPEVPGRGPRGL